MKNEDTFTIVLGEDPTRKAAKSIEGGRRIYKKPIPAVVYFNEESPVEASLSFFHDLNKVFCENDKKLQDLTKTEHKIGEILLIGPGHEVLCRFEDKEDKGYNSGKYASDYDFIHTALGGWSVPGITDQIRDIEELFLNEATFLIGTRNVSFKLNETESTINNDQVKGVKRLLYGLPVLKESQQIKANDKLVFSVSEKHSKCLAPSSEHEAKIDLIFAGRSMFISHETKEGKKITPSLTMPFPCFEIGMCVVYHSIINLAKQLQLKMNAEGIAYDPKYIKQILDDEDDRIKRIKKTPTSEIFKKKNASGGGVDKKGKLGGITLPTEMRHVLMMLLEFLLIFCTAFMCYKSFKLARAGKKSDAVATAFAATFLAGMASAGTMLIY